MIIDHGGSSSLAPTRVNTTAVMAIWIPCYPKGAVCHRPRRGLKFQRPAGEKTEEKSWTQIDPKPRQLNGAGQVSSSENGQTEDNW